MNFSRKKIEEIQLKILEEIIPKSKLFNSIKEIKSNISKAEDRIDRLDTKIRKFLASRIASRVNQILLEPFPVIEDKTPENYENENFRVDFDGLKFQIDGIVDLEIELQQLMGVENKKLLLSKNGNQILEKIDPRIKDIFLFKNCRDISNNVEKQIHRRWNLSSEMVSYRKNEIINSLPFVLLEIGDYFFKAVLKDVYEIIKRVKESDIVVVSNIEGKNCDFGQKINKNKIDFRTVISILDSQIQYLQVPLFSFYHAELIRMSQKDKDSKKKSKKLKTVFCDKESFLRAFNKFFEVLRPNQTKKLNKQQKVKNDHQANFMDLMLHIDSSIKKVILSCLLSHHSSKIYKKIENSRKRASM